MKRNTLPQLKSQDVVILAKLISLNDPDFTQLDLAQTLYLSQSEISSSLSRSSYAGLLVNKGKEVNRKMLFNFLKYGLAVVFPQQPGEMTRGTLTAHSASPLNLEIVSEENYVWPFAKGKARGQSIIPLYPSVPNAVNLDPFLYELLALMDALRVGKAREKNLALNLLEKHIC